MANRKTKLYRVLAFEDGTTENELVATFEGTFSWKDGRICGQALASQELGDFLLINGKAEERFMSTRGNICPGCGWKWDYPRLITRKKYGTKRCECGVMFQIDWEFTPDIELPIHNVDSQMWKGYLRLMERQGCMPEIDPNPLVKLEGDARRIHMVANWLNANSPLWREDAR